MSSGQIDSLHNAENKRRRIRQVQREIIAVAGELVEQFSKVPVFEGQSSIRVLRPYLVVCDTHCLRLLYR